MGTKAQAVRPQSGFTLVEVIIVILVLAILSTILYTVGVPRWRERTNWAATTTELQTLGNAFQLYRVKYNAYPADVDRGLPPGLEELIQDEEGSDTWPLGPYPNSRYDYDAWNVWDETTNTPCPSMSGCPGPEPDTYQISIRFCEIGDPQPTCQANFPKQSFVTPAWDSRSSVYFCIKGSCRSHAYSPLTHPGYCINCGEDRADFYAN